jgi:hypothetical protein
MILMILNCLPRESHDHKKAGQLQEQSLEEYLLDFLFDTSHQQQDSYICCRKTITSDGFHTSIFKLFETSEVQVEAVRKELEEMILKQVWYEENLSSEEERKFSRRKCFTKAQLLSRDHCDAVNRVLFFLILRSLDL